jgi:LPS-assembly protein
MKNKLITLFLILLINLGFFRMAMSEEFIFEVTDLEILENNTIYKGNNRGKITTDTQVELVSNNFEYLKKINRLEANGDVELTDIKNDVIINALKMFYLKSDEKIYTVGKTSINIGDKYYVEGDDLIFLKDKMILFSDRKVTITDNNSNIYKLDKFQYSINEEILKGEKITLISNEKENKQDKYFFETGYFNLNKNEFLGKNINIIFHKKLFDNLENDPRINAVSAYGNEYNTFFDKGVFTSCKKTDKCPPWKMKSSKIRHDKINKQIIYKNAWLEIYDFPVVYFPKFFHPDPSVIRQSGILRPEIGDHDTLGDSLYLPYFFVLSDNSDITVKPRLFNSGTLVLQNEFRKITKNSLTLIDSSITKGHNSSVNDRGDTRSHFFANSKINLNLDDFINSNLEINYEKSSNDNYLKLFDFIKSPLLLNKDNTALESSIKLDLEHSGYDLISSFEMYETLSGSQSDRYQYVLPYYNLSKNFFLDELSGSFNFNSIGNNTLSDTNISSSVLTNNLSYLSQNSFSNIGIKKNFEILIKNINSVGKNSTIYKNSPQSELMSSYNYNLSLPLVKNNETNINSLIPKLSFRISPHEMKNHSSESRRINVDNVFSSNRLGLGDSFETGESITLGIDFIKEKVNINNKMNEMEDYFDFKLATVFKLNEEKNIPNNSTLNKKTSNIFGQSNFKPNENILLNYNFSLTNDFGVIEYNQLGALFEFDNLKTEFNYIEENGVIGKMHIIENKTEYNFNDFNSITFGTRRNRELNLTEYYDLIYEYKNDCLIADIKYRKDYYNSADIKPKEELFFSITIVPFYTYSPNKMILNKDRKD